jgi:hypothetical protein
MNAVDRMVVSTIRRQREDLFLLAVRAVQAADQALLRYAAESLARLDVDVDDGLETASHIAGAIQEAIGHREPQHAGDDTPDWSAGRRTVKK